MRNAKLDSRAADPARISARSRGFPVGRPLHRQSATEVATLVGYKSIDAMGRAFRDAKLPPPSAVQDAIRYR